MFDKVALQLAAAESGVDQCTVLSRKIIVLMGSQEPSGRIYKMQVSCVGGVGGHRKNTEFAKSLPSRYFTAVDKIIQNWSVCLHKAQNIDTILFSLVFFHISFH